MRSPDEINTLYRKVLAKYPDGARDDPYTDGALDALRWVAGDTDTDPFEGDE